MRFTYKKSILMGIILILVLVAYNFWAYSKELNLKLHNNRVCIGLKRDLKKGMLMENIKALLQERHIEYINDKNRDIYLIKEEITLEIVDEKFNRFRMY